MFLPEALGAEFLPSLFQLLRLPAFLGSWLHSPPPLLLSSHLLLRFSSLSYKDLCDYTGPTPITLDHLPTSRSRLQSPLFPCRVTHSQALGFIRTWTGPNTGFTVSCPRFYKVPFQNLPQITQSDSAIGSLLFGFLLKLG